MKILSFSLAFFFSILSCFAQDSPKVDAPITFESKVIDYGTIDYNSNGERKFIFTNNGTEAIEIERAKGSCGCTVPTITKKIIEPGDTGEISVKYDTKRVGPFTKNVTLTFKGNYKATFLTIKGNVNKKPADTQAPEKENNGAPLEKN